MGSIEFRAPWSKRLKIVSAFSIAVLAAAFAAGVVGPPYIPWFASIALITGPLLLVVLAALFMVGGYTLMEDAIEVKRLGWRTRLPLAGLRSVTGDVEAMNRSWRLFGNGGLFSFTGEFWNRRLGRYRALATDPDRAVVLRYAKRTVVITPHDPQHFIMRARTLMKLTEFECKT